MHYGLIFLLSLSLFFFYKEYQDGKYHFFRVSNDSNLDSNVGDQSEPI